MGLLVRVAYLNNNISCRVSSLKQIITLRVWFLKNLLSTLSPDGNLNTTHTTSGVFAAGSVGISETRSILAFLMAWKIKNGSLDSDLFFENIIYSNMELRRGVLKNVRFNWIYSWL